ncbi:MAG: hypothetical protein V7727_22410, partial [Sneathiella sp.]
SLGYTDEEISYDTKIPEENLRCFAAGTLIDMADGTQKSIETIEIGDRVLAYEPDTELGRGELKSAKVSRTMVNQVDELIDFHGVKMTPGHATLCGDGPHQGRHIPIMDILMADGAIVERDGSLIRAATNLPVGSEGDQILQVLFITNTAQKIYDRGQMRAGTLQINEDGSEYRVIDSLKRERYQIHSDGLISQGDEKPHPLYYFGVPPKPEDYVLKKSRLIIGDLYRTGTTDEIPHSSTIGANLGPLHAGMKVN